MKTTDPKLQAILDMNKDVGTLDGVKEKPNVELMEGKTVHIRQA